ncbi:hypothetical protein [Roseibium suaedae]|nr:hypothetical protein [Roseibium suaedae]
MVNSSAQLTNFWKSDEFWDFHQNNGGDENDFRYPSRLEAFIRSFSRDRWTAETLAEAKDLLAREGMNLTPKQLVERLEAEGRIQAKVIYDPNAAALALGTQNVAALQEFMGKYGPGNFSWEQNLTLAQECLAKLNRTETPEAFIDRLIAGGFIRDKRPNAQAQGTEGGDDDNNQGGDDDRSDGAGGGNGRLTLSEFMLRLPPTAEAVIQRSLPAISQLLVVEGDEDGATGLARDLAGELRDMADLQEGETFDIYELLDYILQFARRMGQPADAGSDGGGDDGDSDGDSVESFRMSGYRPVSLETFLDTTGGGSDDSDDGSDSSDSSDGGDSGPGAGGAGNGGLSLNEFIRRLPSHVDAHIEARMGDISWAIGEGNNALIASNIAELMEYILQNADPEDARQVRRAELEAYIRRIAGNRAGNQNGNTGTNTETDTRDPGELTLTDFMLRLPNDIEVLTRPNMGGIREALAADNEDGATGLARDLAAELRNMAGIREGETFDIYALVSYILDLGRRQNQQAGQDGEDVREAGDGATDAGDERVSLSEFIRQLPASADGHIQARMEDISWAIGQGNNALVTRNVQELMNYMLEHSAPGIVEQVDVYELQAYILKIARNMRGRQDGGTGPGNPPGGGNGGGGDDGSDDGSNGGNGGNGGSGPTFREAERTLSMDVDDFLNDDPEEIRRAQARGQAGAQANAQASGQAQEQANAQNGEAQPPRTTPVGNTPLLQLIRNARHLEGTQVALQGMRRVRDALINRDVNAARVAARDLASELLGGPRAEPHLQGIFQQEVREVTTTILQEINGALSEDEKKPRAAARGTDEPDPRNGPRRGPDGGNPGAGAANGGTGNGAPNGGANGGAQQPPAGGYDRATMDRMERQMRERSQEDRRGNQDLGTYAASEIRAITQLIIASQMKAAQQRAEALSKMLQSSNGEAPPMTRDEILRLAFGKAKPKSAAAKEGGAGGDEANDVTAQLIKVVNWDNFCEVYEIDPGEIEEIKKVARKAVKDTDQAKTACKDILSRRNAKAKVKIKNGRYLAEAIVHAMRMKQERQILRKPLKMSDIPDDE